MTRFSVLEHLFSVLEHLFPVLEDPFPVLEHRFPVLERPFLLCPVLSRVPSRILAVPARPEYWLSRPVPSLGKIFSLSRCPFVPGL